MSDGHFSPDNGTEMNFGQVVSVTIPPDHIASFSFTFNAQWVNAICIYDTDLNKVAQKGNKGSVEDWTPWSHRNDTGSPVTLIVSGWHKEAPIEKIKVFGNEIVFPWVQSPARQTGNSQTHYIIGFEDKINSQSAIDFNDAVAIATLHL